MRRTLKLAPSAAAARKAGTAAILALGVAAGACAPGPSAAYRVAKGAGDRAYSSGRYDEAASAYASAQKVADRPRDTAEALYLEASSYQRSRSHQL